MIYTCFRKMFKDQYYVVYQYYQVYCTEKVLISKILTKKFVIVIDLKYLNWVCKCF